MGPETEEQITLVKNTLEIILSQVGYENVDANQLTCHFCYI